jgi:Leucine-rich repeat (LRR) protein
MSLKDKLDSAQYSVIRELEDLSGAPIKQIKEVNYFYSGVLVENNNVVGLSLGERGMKILPDSIGDLRHLRELELHYNSLTTLPDSFGNLQLLEKLFLPNNRIEFLPESFGELKSLKIMYIYQNKLGDLPKSFGNLQSLEELDCRDNKFTEIPECVYRLNSLKDLSMQENNINNISNNIVNLKSLRKLNLTKTNLRYFPEVITKLKTLEVLNYGLNELESLPESFKDMASLKAVWLPRNKLNEFPEPLLTLTGLERLGFTNNQLTSLPNLLTKLSSLEVIVLTMNKFTHFPEILCKLPSLERISLDMNNIEKIPGCVLNLKKLKNLNVTNNPVFLDLSEETKKIFQGLDNLGAEISGWVESSSHKNRIKEFETKKAKALQNKNINFIDIEYDLQLIYFFNEFLNLERYLKMENIPGMPDFKKNLIKVAKLRLYENFDDLKSQGFFRGKSSDLNIKESKGYLELINRFGEEFSIEFNTQRIREIEYDKWENSEENDIVIPYHDVLIIPSTEIFDFSDVPQGSLNTPLPDRMYDFSNPKQLHIKRKGGIRAIDLVDAFKYHLPDYGDYTFFEALSYCWDYKGIPVYSLFIGS